MPVIGAARLMDRRKDRSEATGVFVERGIEVPSALMERDDVRRHGEPHPRGLRRIAEIETLEMKAVERFLVETDAPGNVAAHRHEDPVERLHAADHPTL